MQSLETVKQKLEKTGKYWIGFVGDSITSTEWVHPNWREMVEYVLKDQLDYDWGIKSFNFAYDGATSKDLVNRVGELDLIKPDLVILLTGSNDPFQNISLSEFKSNVKEIINRVEAIGAELILSADNCPMNRWAEKECQPYVEVLKEIDKKCINLFEISKGFPLDRIYTFISEMDIPEERIIKGGIDFWHPNQLGNAYIAKVILKEVWGIEFDPEKYIKNTLVGEKLPRY